jgi:hypothetical protein
MTAAIFLVSVSCGSSGYNPDTQDYSSSPDSSYEGSTSLLPDSSAISLNKFETEIEAEALGSISKVNGDYGYDAALVTAEDGTNYIYMFLADEQMAESILTDSDEDGQMDSDLTLTLNNDQYRLYTQESAGTGSSENAMYGRFLLAGSMIIIVNGPLENRDQIKKSADRFMRNLGFETE